MTEQLAIDGGAPVREAMLPYGRQCLGDEDIRSVTSVLQSDWLTTGPKVVEFETALASELGVHNAVAVSSGTAALHAAVFAAGIGPGDEVITTPMSFAATANSVRFQGGTVVFADIQRDTLNLDPSHVRAKITERTKAIISVDFAGQPADLFELQGLAEEHGLVLIEDAAHALGATYKQLKVGSIAPLTTFSFHPVKHITTGEGGLACTTDSALATRLRSFRNHGLATDFRQRESAGSWYYEMVDLGYNYRLTDIQCALGLSQLRNLPAWVSRRRDISYQYAEALAGLSEIELPVVRSDRQSSWHLYVIRLHLDRLRVGREQIFQALRAENIGVNVHYIPIPWHPYYQRLGYAKGQWPVAENQYERLLSLPIWPGMTDGDATDVVRAVHKVINAYRK